MKLAIPNLTVVNRIGLEKPKLVPRYINERAMFAKNGWKYHRRAYRKHKRYRAGELRRSA
ncbi:MAG: hypothetical protein LBV12_11850 [Puniceicoccales bacterium]|nr:hypothetical protein [Puniceicoccales bacterium]